MIFLFIDDKLNAEKSEHWQREQRERTVKIHETTADLPQFTVIAGTGGSSFSISSGDENKLIVLSETTEIATGFYKVQNDTLYISKKIENGSVQVICKNVGSITLEEHTYIDVNSLSSDILHLKAKESHIHLHSSSIGTVNADLNNATLDSHDLKVEVLNGKLENQANLFVYSSQIRRFGLDVSEDSKYNVVN
jgi:hypothetical protein